MLYSSTAVITPLLAFADIIRLRLFSRFEINVCFDPPSELIAVVVFESLPEYAATGCTQREFRAKQQTLRLGREGIRFAMRDMTEPRLLVIREP